MAPRPNGLPAALGSRIREAREGMPHENGRPVSQHTFAGKVGVHYVTVSQWERGRSIPGTRNLLAISAVSNRPLEFFTHDGEAP